MKKSVFVLLVLSLLLFVFSCNQSPSINIEATQVANDKATLEALATSIAAQQRENDSDESVEQEVVTPSVNPTDAPLLTNTPISSIERDRIIVYRGKSVCDFDKLEGLAFQNNINIDVYGITKRAEFNDALRESDVAGAIYIPGSKVTSASLYELEVFSKNGGHVILIYDFYWSYVDEINEAIQDLFGVMVLEEDIIESTSSVFFSNDSIPSWLSDIQIGITDNYGLYQDVYLIGNTIFQESGYLISDETGNQRLVFFVDQSGRVIFWPAINRTSNQVIRAFFGDGSIEKFDNQKAALKLLYFLLGQ